MGLSGFQKKEVPFNCLHKIIPFTKGHIRTYEGNEIYEQNGKYFLNGKEATSYTFKMD